MKSFKEMINLSIELIKGELGSSEQEIKKLTEELWARLELDTFVDILTEETHSKEVLESKSPYREMNSGDLYLVALSDASTELPSYTDLYTELKELNIAKEGTFPIQLGVVRLSRHDNAPFVIVYKDMVNRDSCRRRQFLEFALEESRGTLKTLEKVKDMPETKATFEHVLKSLADERVRSLTTYLQHRISTCEDSVGGPLTAYTNDRSLTVKKGSKDLGVVTTEKELASFRCGGNITFENWKLNCQPPFPYLMERREKHYYAKPCTVLVERDDSFVILLK